VLGAAGTESASDFGAAVVPAAVVAAAVDAGSR
jgi:hypothetical protein